MTAMTTPSAEQRLRFDRLCLLRALYDRGGSHDAMSVMPLTEVAAYARALLIDPYWRADATRSAASTV